ncbi:MAG TPA: putative transporter [Bacteroidales bacterium]|nr:putative transporter [Bacteroidales bacterium]
MDWIIDLFTEFSIGHAIMLIALTITLGILLGKIKIANISLGITWILFAGIGISHFGLRVNPDILSFTKEFGLILFVYSIGLQVGPSFFSSLRKGGLRLNMLALAIVFLGGLTTYIIHFITKTDLATMVGIFSGAVTSTPSLGAAQQTFKETFGTENPSIALGYAVTYPLGVVGVIISSILIKNILRIKLEKEKIVKDEDNILGRDARLSIIIRNQGVVGRTVEEIITLFDKPVVFTRVMHSDKTVEVVTNNTIIQADDTLRVVVEKTNIEALLMLLGERRQTSEEDWETENHDLISKRIVVTKPELNGQKIGNLRIRSLYEVNITRISRSGIELIATYDLQLQMGDRVTVVGKEENIDKVALLLGNSMKRLNQPNLMPIFLGIFIGIIVGSIPLVLPGLNQTIKLGLAGGTLIVAILMGRYGPYYKLVTFATTSANMMIREIGITLFLASVGLASGESFIQTIVEGGYIWIFYGFIITLVPTLIVGIFARLRYNMSIFAIWGLLAGSSTNASALAFANNLSPDDSPNVSYATVYPLTMFLRVVAAQILIIMSI